MPYQLRDDLSFCEVNGRIVFLDIESDRYFRTSESIERAFSSFIEEGDNATIDVIRLVEKNILIETPTTQHRAATPRIARPRRSAIEQRPDDTPLDLITTLEVFLIVYSTWRRLQKRRLKTTIDEIVAYRRWKTKGLTPQRNPEDEYELVKAAIQFNSARRYVPFETSCLLDSLSLLRFLSRHRLRANIVFGVTLDPFSAHCWVQANDLALNETVSDANVYTPIRRV